MCVWNSACYTFFIQTQQHIHRTIVEKENETYKSQLQVLQVTNYSLERKVRELEVKLQLQISSSEKHLGQLTEFENKHSTVVQQGKQLAESQVSLEKQDCLTTQFQKIQKQQPEELDELQNAFDKC
ncbi:hypothetical protein ACJMK2_002166 [Sinanodonta woodiana]|uniref:Uncharacterized protein n=1 Tax=Sinanodonta woodiana TaxID=1069815 RepID=A0ABD3XUE5_SINWO